MFLIVLIIVGIAILILAFSILFSFIAASHAGSGDTASSRRLALTAAWFDIIGLVLLVVGILVSLIFSPHRNGGGGGGKGGINTKDLAMLALI